MSTGADNKQSPQVINSADGKMRILNHYAYRDRFGCYCIQGAVKYLSPEPNLCAHIKIDYFTTDGEQIDTEESTVEFLNSGGTSSFFMMYSGLRRGEIQIYQITITSAVEV